MCKEDILYVTTSLERCPFCGSSLIIKYNRNPKTIITLNGAYIVLERVRKCSNKDCPGNSISFKSEDLQRITLPGRTFCLDVILYIGLLRYEEHKKYDEIIEKLEKGGISISKGEVFNLCLSFESLIRGWHEERIEEIKDRLDRYILSVDGTYSYKGKTLYIFRDYITGLVLYAETTEKDDKAHIKPLFEKVIQMYGKPIAVISDMQDAFISSVKELLPDIPHQYCQYHFLKNAGKYMEKYYKRLGDEMKNKGVKEEAKKVDDEFKKSVGEKNEAPFETDCEEFPCVVSNIDDVDIKIWDTSQETNNAINNTNKDIPKSKVLLYQQYIIHTLWLLLDISTDDFPFELYYVELYLRYRRVRTTVRRCISGYPYNDEYKKALCKLDGILTSLVADKAIKSLVGKLQSHYKVFQRLRAIFKNEEKKPVGAVKSSMRRFLSFLENKARADKKYTSLCKQIKHYWEGLFYTYEYDWIPRTNNDMESFIKNVRGKWKRITGHTRVDGWIVYHTPTGIYMFNVLGANPPLEKLGFKMEIFDILSSVSNETYKQCLKEYELRRTDSRIKRRANRNVNVVLNQIEEINRKMSGLSLT